MQRPAQSQGSPISRRRAPTRQHSPRFSEIRVGPAVSHAPDAAMATARKILPFAVRAGFPKLPPSG